MHEETGKELLEQLARDDGDEAFAGRFVEHVLDLLQEEDRQEDPSATAWVLRDNLDDSIIERLDGFDLRGEEAAERASADLFVALTYPSEAAHVVTPAEVALAFKPLRHLAARLVGPRADAVELLPPELADLARSLRESSKLSELRLVLLTNGVVRDFDRTPDKLGAATVRRQVVDLTVLHRFQHPEAIPVDFATHEGPGIPCVRLPSENGVYRSFLAVIPGAFLATLYRRHGQHVLEANVRAYLKATGKVNKGILKTIREEPQMFFAYNNGVTATAEEIVLSRGPDGNEILVRCQNLQIVNGGQTTVSLANAMERKIPLEGVHVAVKINEVLQRDRAASLVNNISIFANSQNKVSGSDLGANQPFHIRLQKLAEQEVAPVAAPGEKDPAQWYYERMRGQYQQDLVRLTPRARKAFQARFPKRRVLGKTDVGRLVMTWERKPYVVSSGGEKNYEHFVNWLDERGWNAVDADQPDAAWFHALVAKAILADACDRLVRAEKIPGYKANIVTYTLALLAHLHGEHLDLERLWQTQAVPPELEAWLLAAIRHVHAHITKPPREGMNIGEWCKKEACWEGLLKLPFVVPRLSLRALPASDRLPGLAAQA